MVGGSASQVWAVTAGLHCASCVDRLRRHAVALAGLEVTSVDLMSRTIRFQVAEGVTPEAITAHLAAGGFTAHQVETPATQAGAEVLRTRALQALVLAALAVTADALGQGIWGGLVSLLTLIGPGRTLLAGAWRERRRPGMDALVSAGAVAALILALVHGGGHGHAGAAVVALVLVGRWLEDRARTRALAGVEALARRRPPEAWRVTPAGDLPLALELVVPGDLLRLYPGGTVPVDGVVEDGGGEIDESLLTGETLPVPKGPGDPVMAGTVNRLGSLVVRATATGEAATLARLAALVRTARSSRPPMADVLQRLLAWFTPGVALLALLTALWWTWQGSWIAGLAAAATVLVVACPCALGLAVPVAVAAAASAAARNGIFLTTPRALENAASVSVVVFDKTGTLTTGEFRLAGIWAAEGHDEDAVLALAAAAEQGSEHPLAMAIRCAALERALVLVTPARFRAEPGAGIAAELNGRQVVVGTPDHLQRHGIAPFAGAPIEGPGAVLVHVAVEGVAIGCLRLRDAVRDDAEATMARLQELGLEVHLVSGDSLANADVVARRLGITTVVARATPAAKVAHVQNLQAQGHRVALVGDGLNDAAALAQADLGIALGGGADAAQRAGDAVLATDRVDGVAELVGLARSTRWVIRQNLVLATAYNLTLLPLATGMIPGAWQPSPTIAAAAMAASSLVVVLNALRLRIARPDPRWRSLRAGIEGVNAEMSASLGRFNARWRRR